MNNATQGFDENTSSTSGPSREMIEAELGEAQKVLEAIRSLKDNAHWQILTAIVIAPTMDKVLKDLRDPVKVPMALYHQGLLAGLDKAYNLAGLEEKFMQHVQGLSTRLAGMPKK